MAWWNTVNANGPALQGRLSVDKPAASTYSSKMNSYLDFEIAFFEGIERRLPHYCEVLEILGSLYTRVGRINDGLRIDRRLIHLCPDNATARYNYACSLALRGQLADALRSLRLAITLGYDDREWMRKDPDLKALRSHPAFLKLLSTLKTAHA